MAIALPARSIAQLDRGKSMIRAALARRAQIEESAQPGAPYGRDAAQGDPPRSRTFAAAPLGARR
jgi:hypothetical protein